LTTIVYHYLNVVKDNYVDYLRNKPEVNRKKYIYILRCLFWIEHAKLTYFEQWRQSVGNSDLNGTGNKKELDAIIPPFCVDQLIQETIEKQHEVLQSGLKDQYPVLINIYPKQEEGLKEFIALVDRKKSSSGQWDKEPRIEVGFYNI